MAMTFWRVVGLISLVLSVLDAVSGLADNDGAGGTAAEIAMVAAMFATSDPSPGRPPATVGQAPIRR